MFSFKNKPTGLNLPIDIHSHILPGIDDGSRSVEESLYMLHELSRRGVKTIWLTPHIKEKQFPNTLDSISEAFDRFVRLPEVADIGIELKIAAEYYIGKEFLKMTESGAPLLPIKDRYILVEPSMAQEPLFLYEALFALRQRGYTPILAHPERYIYYHNNLKAYDKLKHSGCLFQLNLFALAGYYGKSVKKCAAQLLADKKYDFVATDIHNRKQLDILDDKNIRKVLNETQFKNNILQ